ncbi:ribonuclease P protein component [Gordonia insulae]|uniref:ribonuclease P protein component n=1 Tax=Gordonia insulae TaxID=2420509 RepID=UPI0038CC165E
MTTPDLVIHVLPLIGSDDRRGDPRSTGIATVGGPWLGLIVSKAVGNAVIRHRVARRLRAAFMHNRDSYPSSQTMTVIRARPSAAELSSVALGTQLVEALSRRRVREAFESTGATGQTASRVLP